MICLKHIKPINQCCYEEQIFRLLRLPPVMWKLFGVNQGGGVLGVLGMDMEEGSTIVIDEEVLGLLILRHRPQHGAHRLLVAAALG